MTNRAVSSAADVLYKLHTAAESAYSIVHPDMDLSASNSSPRTDRVSNKSLDVLDSSAHPVQ